MKKCITLLIVLFSLSDASNYSFRKYDNVKKFYQPISKEIIDLCIQHNVPPATILAIAGLESGYGSGYVARITGNILSLGPKKGDKELPPLYLPYCKGDKTKKILITIKKQEECGKENLIWSKRPPSLKRDYRPAPYAGTDKNLAYLTYNPNMKTKAQLKCVDDFLSNWLSEGYRYKVFKDARIWLNKKVKKEGKKTLFKTATNTEFIHKIGGIPNSFNYRKSWPAKVIKIMKKTGLIELTADMYINKKSFKETWRK